MWPVGPGWTDVEVDVTEPAEIGVLYGPKGEVLKVVMEPRPPFGF